MAITLENLDMDEVVSAWGDFELYVPNDDPKASEAIRVLFPDVKVVIKMFDLEQQELYSLKIWEGDLQKVVSYWRMVQSDRSLTDREESNILRAFANIRSKLLEL